MKFVTCHSRVPWPFVTKSTNWQFRPTDTVFVINSKIQALLIHFQFSLHPLVALCYVFPSNVDCGTAPASSTVSRYVSFVWCICTM